jgi:serine/threonine protein kinase
VILVKKTASDGSDQHSAINVMKKSHIVSSCSVTYTVAVKEALVLHSGHPFITTLYLCFQTKEHLFFMLEYVSTGNIANELENVREFSEKRALFYAAEITLALQFLHSYGNLHRVYTYDNMAQSFSNVVKAYQEEINLPFVPKGSFGLRVVGDNCFPTIVLFFGPRKRHNIFTRVWTRSLRHPSCLIKDKLTLLEVMPLTHYITQKVPSAEIQKQLHIEEHTASDWFQFCREVILDFVGRKSETIGG